MYRFTKLTTGQSIHRNFRLIRAFCTKPTGSGNVQTSAQSASQKNVQGGPITWKAVALFGIIGTGGLAYYSMEKQRRMEDIMKPKTIGKASIGGPFELVDEHGKMFTQDNLLGRWTLVYFGFTMCPDICPAELTKISEALEILQKHGHNISSAENAKLTPLFISVDPERDTPERSAEYARGFHDSFNGVSGTLDQVKNTAKQYRVYYSKDETPGEDYLVDHSIITYLMDPEGNFVEFYGKNTTSTEMAARIEAKMLARR